MFGGAVVTPSSCGLDVVNYGTASGAAIDHLGSADFQGWVGDSATGKVPASLWLVLDGAQAFYAPARTGVGRPDVAASKHNRAFAQAGFNVTTYLPGLPVGDYRVAIYYRIDGREMVCPTQVTVSVQ